jgi:hypothetical protein
MPERETVKRAEQKLRRGEAPTTAAGEFVREEMHHIRRGKHGARSTRQAIAIGLSKARRAGVPLSPPARGSRRTRRSAARDLATGQHRRRPRTTSPRRRRAVTRALRREPHQAATRRELATQARRAAKRRGPSARSAAARKAARTRTRTTRRGAAATRSRHA